MALIKTIGILLIFVGFLFAVPVQLITPVSQELQGGEVIDLGSIGPGQTVTLEINPSVQTGGIHGIGGKYDLAWAEELPEGWKGKQSKLYGNPLQVAISAASNANEGDYTAKVIVGDEEDAEQLGNLSFNVKIHITWDVMDSSVTPKSVVTGPGQPARYYITITNKGSTGDVFEIRSKGIERWRFAKQTYVPAQSSKTIFYEIVEEEEEFYEPIIEVVSSSSDIIKEEHKVEFQVSSDLLADYKATNNGILLFPIFESAIYSFAGLIANLIG